MKEKEETFNKNVFKRNYVFRAFNLCLWGLTKILIDDGYKINSHFNPFCYTLMRIETPTGKIFEYSECEEIGKLVPKRILQVQKTRRGL